MHHFVIILLLLPLNFSSILHMWHLYSCEAKLFISSYIQLAFSHLCTSLPLPDSLSLNFILDKDLFSANASRKTLFEISFELFHLAIKDHPSIAFLLSDPFPPTFYFALY